MKLERDTAQILSGVMEGVTIGSPLALLIGNKDHEKWAGIAIEPFIIPRPGHVDLIAALKYGYSDLRPGLERASARDTAARVAVGAICKHFLAQFGIQVGGYVTALGDVTADLAAGNLYERITQAETSAVRCPDPKSSDLMLDAIQDAIKEKNTLGGIIEVVALGLPPGLGTYMQWDKRLDARLAAAVISVQAIKGFEIGSAFANASQKGTQTQDAIHLDPNGQITRPTMHSGGIEGGMSTGEPLIMRAAMKPIATTLTPQTSINLATGEPTQTKYERSDFCPVPRAVPVIESMVALVLADSLIEKLGGDSMHEMQPRFKNLRQARLDDLQINNQPHIFWP
jgi:chorismate synthase